MFKDLGKMLKLAGEMKTRLPEMRAKLAASEYSAEAGDGAVVVTVTGNMQVSGIRIRPDLVVSGDAARVEDLVKDAVSGAQKKAADAAAEAMKELTGGIDLPGMADWLA